MAGAGSSDLRRKRPTAIFSKVHLAETLSYCSDPWHIAAHLFWSLTEIFFIDRWANQCKNWAHWHVEWCSLFWDWSHKDQSRWHEPCWPPFPCLCLPWRHCHLSTSCLLSTPSLKTMNASWKVKIVWEYDHYKFSVPSWSLLSIKKSSLIVADYIFLWYLFNVEPWIMLLVE